MFGSSPFGQSSSSPFGSQPVFGQSTNASSNPFAPKPFGSTTPFGSQTGSSFFGSNATGMFGNQNSSPLGSTSVFGASSTPAFGSSAPAFGSSTPAFGASSTTAFGSSSSSFGSTSVFGQKPAFGAFGSSTTQTSPFASSFQQSQPAFGSSLFGSSQPFGSSNQPAFGATTTPAFGPGTTQAFGATSTPAFGSTVSPPFGSTGGAFGASSSSVFGSSTPAFGASTTPAFGTASTGVFGATSTPSFSFGSSPAFGQSGSAFGSSPFGTATSPFGAQSSPFGAQATTPTFGNAGFGQSAFGTQRGGSRVAPYTPTAEVVESGTQQAGKLESISAMPVYKEKSHEELRWEDYQLGDKGGPAPASQPTSSISFGSSGFGSASTPAFPQTSANPFSSASPSNPFAPKPPVFSASGFGSSSSAFGSSPFGATTTSNPFGSTSASTPTLFGTSSATTFGTSTSSSPFGSASSSPFGSSTSVFGSSAVQATTPAFNSGLSFANTQSSPLFQSSTPSLGQASSAFGQTGSSFGQSTPSFAQSSIFSTPSSGFGGNLFSSTPSLLTSTNTGGFGQTTPSLSTPFQPAQPAQSTGGAFGFGSFNQTPAAGTSGFAGTPNMFNQSTFGQPPVIQSSVVAQQAPTNPFGTLPAMPQMSIARTGASPSIQYGISSLPVVDKAAAALRISPLLTSRHLSQRRMRLPARKYHPKPDGHKVPFFNDDEETPSTPKADALFIPRENPRALVIRPMEQCQPRMSEEKTIPSKYKSSVTPENGKSEEAVFASPMNGSRAEDREDSIENGFKDQHQTAKQNQKTSGTYDDHSIQKGDSYITLTSHRAGGSAIAYEHGADIETVMPKLRHSDYYTEPRIQELAAKERSEPGYCRRVKDFVVGRHGYGSIKFIGETDVRRLDLESLIQFNNREVIVYVDESKKPPVGQGLNKPAEVTLLNIKCFDKKTGQHYTEGPRIEKYKEMLKRKAEDQGAEFVSYDPIKGEWKFRVNHFSKYKLIDEEDEEPSYSPAGC